MKARVNLPEFKSLGSAKYSRIIQVLNSAKQGLENIEDFDIPVEYLIGGCYPELWENFKNNIRQQFDAGYQQGLIDAANIFSEESCEACQISYEGLGS